MNRNPLEGLRPGQSQLEQNKEEQELTPEEMREKLRNPSFLPSSEQLSHLFKEFYEYPLYDDPVEKKWREWRDFFNNEKIFEIWTEEYINAFGSYLEKRIDELGGTLENPAVILEIGAGNGRLTHFLQEKMNGNKRIAGKFRIVASDSGEWKIPPAFPVENIPYKEALKKYKPDIVFISWMPYKKDFTADVRAAESVKEYILIGQRDGGCCGDEWLTWGVTWSPDEKEIERREKQMPLYKAGGFERINQDLGPQFSRLDVIHGMKNQTSTVSFEREK